MGKTKGKKDKSYLPDTLGYRYTILLDHTELYLRPTKSGFKHLNSFANEPV